MKLFLVDESGKPEGLTEAKGVQSKRQVGDGLHSVEIAAAELIVNLAKESIQSDIDRVKEAGKVEKAVLVVIEDFPSDQTCAACMDTISALQEHIILSFRLPVEVHFVAPVIHSSDNKFARIIKATSGIIRALKTVKIGEDDVGFIYYSAAINERGHNYRVGPLVKKIKSGTCDCEKCEKAEYYFKKDEGLRRTLSKVLGGNDAVLIPDRWIDVLKYRLKAGKGYFTTYCRDREHEF